MKGTGVSVRQDLLLKEDRKGQEGRGVSGLGEGRADCKLKGAPDRNDR